MERLQKSRACIEGIHNVMTALFESVVDRQIAHEDRVEDDNNQLSQRSSSPVPVTAATTTTTVGEFETGIRKHAKRLKKVVRYGEAQPFGHLHLNSFRNSATMICLDSNSQPFSVTESVFNEPDFQVFLKSKGGRLINVCHAESEVRERVFLPAVEALFIPNLSLKYPGCSLNNRPT